MTDDYDPDDADAREEELAREVWAGGDPPLDPLIERVAPVVLTAAERERVADVRDTHTWYRAHGHDDARVGDLLALLDRLTGATSEEVNRGATTVSEDPLPVPGGGAARAAPTAAAPAGEPGDPLRPAQPAGVAPDEETGIAALLGRLDGLRAELAVLLDDARTRHQLPWTLVNAGLEGVDTATYFLTHHDPGEETP